MTSTTNLSEVRPLEYRSTGVRAIDRLLGGKGWAVSSIVLLEGMYGVGKSRLLRHLGVVEIPSEDETSFKALLCHEESISNSFAVATTRATRGANSSFAEARRHAVDVVLVLTRNARRNRLELRCEDKNRFGRVDPDLFVAFDDDHKSFTLMRTKRRC